MLSQVSELEGMVEGRAPHVTPLRCETEGTQARQKAWRKRGVVGKDIERTRGRSGIEVEKQAA